MNTVLVLGGYGGFGARLCRRLAAEGWRVVVAGRDIRKAEALAKELANAVAARADRAGGLGHLLAEHRPLLLVDASGPFQGSDFHVVEACIAAAVNYLDIADARHFVCGIDALGERALAANVAVISGASSVPALSGAVIRELADGFDRIDAVEVAISASDRATAGSSVARAILSYVGKPVKVWRGQRWERLAGFQHLDRLSLKAHDTPRFHRRVALAEVPDLEIWPRVLPGRPATLFHAGPEFGFQVLALWLLSWPVRWGWIRSLDFLAPLLLPMQAVTRRFSDGRSAMSVELSGRSDGRFTRRRWELLAIGGQGPEIPVLAAQLLARRLARGELEAGARSAHHELELADFQGDFERLGIVCREKHAEFSPLYRRVLGERFDQLPEPIREMHEICGDGGARGQAVVERGTNPLARVVGSIMRFPRSGRHDLHVSFHDKEGRENWTRDFGGQRFHSELSIGGGRLTERFGPLRFFFDLPVSPEGLEMKIVRWTAFGVPMPLWLAPRVEAEETVHSGLFAFNVVIGLPLIGQIVRYSGTLERPG